ncbi:LacI family transcriptional regulator [Glycomyces paridis]|uniref:LacI family transcriptional regulator n=1 Tax=Glycomyces paridis TaxID=2126555 RepID=A0A4S8PJK2_9ACTN|nr:LacI family transcriptional regulator [Glycomyces paridis]
MAAAAGTSVPTISKVLSGRSDVSAEMREKVMRAVADLGYRGRAGRGAPPSARPAMVELVMSGLEGTWANRALSGVERAAAAAGVALVVSVAHRDDDAWLTRLLDRNLGGAVLALVDATPEQLATLDAARVPVVLLDPVTQPPSTVAGVGATNWAGGRAAAEHLIALGHERLGIVAGHRGHLYSRARVDGFRSAAIEAGLRFDETSVVFTDWKRGDAAERATALLTGDRRPTAVFACSDNIAVGVYDAAEALALRIPDDLAVIGFDDLPEGQWLRPALTTIRQPIAEMGEAALRMLLRIMAHPPTNSPREELATDLIVRGSTAPLPR